MQYDNGSDVAFLVWLWYELYGDEPFDASVLTRLRALPEPFAERLDSQASWDVGEAVYVGEWGKALGCCSPGSPRAPRSAQPNATSSPPCSRQSGSRPRPVPR